MNKLVMLAALGALSVVAGCATTGGSSGSAPAAAPAASAAAAAPAAAPASSAAGACAGTWKFDFETPMGPQSVVMKLTQSGEQLTGKATDANGEVDVTGTCKGDALALVQKVNSPMGELNLDFSGTVAGDSISGGTVKFGDFGSGPFTGKKQ